MSNKSIMESKKITGISEGFEPFILQILHQKYPTRKHILYITPSMEKVDQLKQRLQAAFPNPLKILTFPEWDCLPYDRISPSQDITNERLQTLYELMSSPTDNTPILVLTSGTALIQRLPPRFSLEGQTLTLTKGKRIAFSEIITYLTHKGYHRTETVRESGEFAVRGDIIDLFPTGNKHPLRINFFGDEIESIRLFDPLSQSSMENQDTLILSPNSEICLTDDTIKTFRQNYRRLFGATPTPLYESISQGRRYGGMEHWLSLFFPQMSTLFDYLPNALILQEHGVNDAIRTRLELIQDYYHNRSQKLPGDKSPPFNPILPQDLFMTLPEWVKNAQDLVDQELSPFQEIDLTHTGLHFDCKKNTFNVKQDNPFDFIHTLRPTLDKSLILACSSDGSRDRLADLLKEHDFHHFKIIEKWPESLIPSETYLLTYPLENGFETPEFTIITEQDLLGEKMIRSSKKAKKGKLLFETNQLSIGDLIVHRDHGIGQYQGLIPVTVDNAIHDCLSLLYDGGDKLFLPVENIDTLTKYGSEEATAQLDKLGTAAWQNRKARVKNRIRAIADHLIKLAAERALHKGDIFNTSIPDYDEFCARFPYVETEDQLRAIEETLEDLTSGKPMDRLICGDVGFGKTEVALRAAFMAVANGKQVAIITPTTLLCRQHFNTFKDRFAQTSYRVEQLSRFITPAEASKIRQDLEEGKVNIIIATHALFSDKIHFKDLGLVIIDEEQHFGVKQKEKLKNLQKDVHILTLTATPIPRTLQMALTGVREMSLIASPPIDRLAVRTFVTPFDPLTIREAILREYYRGGQIFFVCPRLEEMATLEESLKTLVPEIKIISAHGKLSATQLENVMTAFYNREYDLLLSTNIVESGIDIANANTLIIYRADLFGLAQLYQLRGRVGRSKTQSYAYLTMLPDAPLSSNAQRRLEIMQTLDKLGAGFTLASHDMDIRGTGNLVGEEQSGHIKEVGVELYQNLLQEAILMLRAEAETGITSEEDWSPQINLGTSVMIPETYIPDLNLRLSLYRRVATLGSREEIDAFAAEMIDRFGKLPSEVQNLLEIIEIKSYCRHAGIEKIDAGPKGLVVTLKNNTFKNPEKLFDYVQNPKVGAKIRPDQKIVFIREWDSLNQRVKNTKTLCRNLQVLAK